MTVKVQKRLRDLDSGVANAALILIPDLVQVGVPIILMDPRTLKSCRHLLSPTKMPDVGRRRYSYNVGRTAQTLPNYLYSHTHSAFCAKSGEHHAVPLLVSL